MNCKSGKFFRPMAAALFALMLFTTIHPQAQNVTGTILGTVLDPTGSAVPDAAITVRNVDTGATRSTASSTTGIYQVPQLPAGHYTVEAKATGFRLAQVENVVVTVATESRVDIHLQVGQVAEKVTVSAEIPTVETTSSEVGQLMDEKIITAIPLNARDLNQLAGIQPGVQYNYYHNFGKQIVVAGSRSEQNRYLQEGIDTTWTFKTAPVSTAGVIMGVEAVREFKVLVSDYSAAYGERAGGVVNTIFKSGTNNWHGSGYEFLRDSVFDARAYFDHAAEKPSFRRHQFGGSFGGPVRTDKTFFFLNFEGLRHNKGLTNVAFVPDGAMRASAVAGVQPYLALIPQCNGPYVGAVSGGICQAFSNANQRIGENYGLVKMDHQISAKNSLSASYNLDFSEQVTPTQLPNWADHQDYRKNIFTVQDTHVLSNNLVNTLRFGINRTYFFFRTDTEAQPGSSLYVMPNPVYTPTSNPQFPVITITGLSGLGVTRSGTTITPRWFGYTAGSLGESLNWVHGRHAVQFGVDYKRWDDNSNVDNPASRGQYTFLSLSQFLSGRAAQFSEYVPSARRLERGYRQYLLGLYAEDSFKLKPNLTLTYGLRWEYVPGPSEVNGLISNLHKPESDPAPILGEPYFNVSKRLFAPRLGFNWDPFKQGKTSVRGGFGIFFDQIEAWYYFLQSPGLPPFTTTVTLTNTGAGAANSGFPLPTLVGGAAGVQALVPATAKADFQATMPFNAKTPTKYSYNLSVQQQLWKNFALMVGYVGAQGRHLGRSENFNDCYPTGQDANNLPYWAGSCVATLAQAPATGPYEVKPNPNFNLVGGRVFDVNSFYNSLQVVLERQAASGFTMRTNYTFSECVDDSSNEFGGGSLNGGDALQYTRDRTSSRGRCSYNASQSANITLSYDIPFARGLTGKGKTLLDGWQVSTLVAANNGVPFEILTGFNNAHNGETGAGPDRPDLVSGCSPGKATLGTASQWFDPNCFVLPASGHLGTLPSRYLKGPNLFTGDLSLKKVFSFKREGTTAEFRWDVFNLLNRANFQVPSVRTLFNASRARNGSAGVITDTVTEMRQMQLGVRFSF